MIKLSNRLQKVYDFIPQNGHFADVGCDHGYLSIAVAQSGLSDHVIAMDVKKGPLDCAKKNIASEGLTDKIELRLSDGLQALSVGEAEVICVCGMGGLLMKKIVSEGLAQAEAAKCLILEPQSEVMELRTYLSANGFVFDAEDMASEENKFYPIFRLHYEKDQTKRPKLTKLELKYGPCLLKSKNELFINMLEKNQREFSEIKENLETKAIKNNAIPIQKRIEELEEELNLIDQALSMVGGANRG